MLSLIRGARLDTEARVLDQLRYPDQRDRSGGSSDALVSATEPPAVESRTQAGMWPMDGGQSPNPHAGAADPWTEALPVLPEQPHPTYEEYRQQINDELQQQRQAAHTQGYTEGKKSGLEEAAAEYREQIGHVSRLVAGMRMALESEIDGLTDIGAEIVFEAVIRILGRSYLERDGVIAVIREVIHHAKDRSRLVIRVSPADYARLEGERDALIEGWNSQQVDIIADDRVELGGCLLESPAGNLDGRLEVQLQQLRETLLNARQRRSESVFES
jgi:flagellar assembly protein FliH